MRRDYSLKYIKYYKYDIDELSPESLKQILCITYFLKEPELIGLQLAKVRREDSYNSLFPPGLPAYHNEIDCDRLNQDYKNLKLPKGIAGNKERVLKCRALWNQIIQSKSVENSDTRNPLRHTVATMHDNWIGELVFSLQQSTYFKEAFKIDGIDIMSLTKESFIPEYRLNSGKTLLSLEEELDAIYNQFKVQTKQIAKGLKDLKKIHLQSQHIFKEHYETKLYSLLVDFSIQKYNPNLEFQEDILKALGFTQCISCCGYEKDDEEDNEIEYDAIEDFRGRMPDLYEVLALAGTIRMHNTVDTALEDEEQIKDAAVGGGYFSFHAITRRIQGIIKVSSKGRVYAEIAQDKYGKPIEAASYEVYAVKVNDISKDIKGERKIVLLVPLKS